MIFLIDEKLLLLCTLIGIRDTTEAIFQNDFFAIIFNLHLFSKIMIYLFFYYDYVVIKIQKIFSCALSSKLYATICAFIIGRLQSYHMFFYVLKLLCENEFTLAPSMLLRQSS